MPKSTADLDAQSFIDEGTFLFRADVLADRLAQRIAAGDLELNTAEVREISRTLTRLVSTLKDYRAAVEDCVG